MPIEPTGPVVVGVDGSPASLAALDLAADEAAARVTPLVVVHAHDGSAPRSTADLLTTATARVAAEHPALSVAAESVLDSPVHALVAQARTACLVVVGRGGRRCLRGGPATSVAAQVIGEAEAPVLVFRPFDAGATEVLPRPVLVGVAADGYSDAVVEFAFAEATLRGAPLHAMYIWSESEDAVAPSSGYEHGRHRAEQLLTDTIEGWSQKYPQVLVHETTRFGLDVAVALTAASRTAQLAVVGGSRGRGPSRIARSVPYALVHRAGCPVVVVPVP